MPASDTPAPLPEIDAATLARHLAQGSVVLIDVREAEEHDDERIAGSTLLPMSAFDPAQAAPGPDGRAVVLYCLSGTRSARAAAQIQAAGQAPPLTLRDGLLGWKRAGLPTEGSGASKG